MSEARVLDATPVDKTKPGLQMIFKLGEQLPWKGLWFEVASVEHDALTLKPIGMTWQRFKEIRKEKHR